MLARDMGDPWFGAPDDPETCTLVYVSAVGYCRHCCPIAKPPYPWCVVGLRCDWVGCWPLPSALPSKPVLGQCSLGTRVTPGLGHPMTQKHVPWCMFWLLGAADAAAQSQSVWWACGAIEQWPIALCSLCIYLMLFLCRCNTIR
jgi:hypothetical protein